MLKFSFGYALVAIAFLSAAQERSAQPNQSNTQSEKQTANAQPVNTPTQNPSPQIDNAAEAARERQQQNRDAKEDEFKTEQLRQNRIIVRATVWMAAFAGVNLVVALIYAYFALRTLWAVEKQSTHANEQVGAMREQLGIMKLELRPYIGISAEVAAFLSGHPMDVVLTVTNDGNSATELSLECYMVTVSKPLLPAFDIEPLAVIQCEIGPHGKRIAKVLTDPFPDQEFVAITEDRLFVYLYGDGSYSGIGGPYTVSFCFVYDTYIAGFSISTYPKGKKPTAESNG